MRFSKRRRRAWATRTTAYWCWEPPTCRGSWTRPFGAASRSASTSPSPTRPAAPTCSRSASATLRTALLSRTSAPWAPAPRGTLAQISTSWFATPLCNPSVRCKLPHTSSGSQVRHPGTPTSSQTTCSPPVPPGSTVLWRWAGSLCRGTNCTCLPCPCLICSARSTPPSRQSMTTTSRSSASLRRTSARRASTEAASKKMSPGAAKCRLHDTSCTYHKFYMLRTEQTSPSAVLAVALVFIFNVLYVKKYIFISPVRSFALSHLSLICVVCCQVSVFILSAALLLLWLLLWEAYSFRYSVSDKNNSYLYSIR